MKKKSVKTAEPPENSPKKTDISPPEPPPAVTPSLEEESENASGESFPVVGIGASAGGLEAFTELLQALPANTGMAFVFIQHLDPKHVSLLTELLQRQTTMRVQEATNGLAVEPNNVYVIPRNTHMILLNGVLTLTPRVTAPFPHMPIDPFLRSLASELKSRSIGVILSGNASDGALGMMAIKSAGGITFAQSPDSSKHDGMPRSAIAAGCVDFVFTPHDIGTELARLGQHPYVVPSHAEAAETPATQEALQRILGMLWKSTGVDFAHYKPSTIRRRIFRRMALRRMESLDAYVALLRAEPAELAALYEDILINVTEFFRDPEVFEVLKKNVFPKLTANRDRSSPIRIWVAGCSSGEELYSIAIALLEFLDETGHASGIQIFGTDISDVALEKARNGIYSPSSVQEVSSERLRRFFTKVDSNYQISKRVRELCVFAKQNMIKDAPFSRLDLISCRNVLIYLGPVLQKRMLPIFHYGLKPDGFLVLGSSETVGSFSDLFAPIDKKSKIYAKLEVASRKALEFPVRERDSSDREATPERDWSEAEVLREADRIVLGKYAPAGVVVDDELNILQFRGRVGAYLQPFPGMASLNLLKMTSEGLSGELRNALQKARREDTAVRREALRVRADAGLIELNFEVVPFRPTTGRPRRYLILFEEARVERPAAIAGKSKKRPSMSTLERENTHLREELAATKRYLQSMMEEHESATEELRSANEEIQSSNEELQSTNEELETAKEELQSTNEELNTVNDELQTRNLQLAQAGNDLMNLLSSVNIPIVMLGPDLRIRRFTPASQRVLNLIPSDVGRPISDINLNLELPRLDRLLAEVMETLTPTVLDVKDLNGRTHSLRIRPYRTEDNKIDGVVMVLVDLDMLRIATDGLDTAATAGDGQSSDERGDALRAFSAGLLIAQERERHHLSRELHDDLTQRLALLELNLETLQRKHPTAEQLAENLQSFHQQVTGLSEDLRRIAYRLHPSVLDDLGLAVAVESFVRHFSERENIQVAFHHSNIPAIVDADAALCLYRVLQESLHNVSKHSGAHSVQVHLSGADGRLRMTVKDTGSGFDSKAIRGKGGLGLRSMEERTRLLGGQFRIHSDSRGTEVVVEVPHSGQSSTSISAP